MTFEDQECMFYRIVQTVIAVDPHDSDQRRFSVFMDQDSMDRLSQEAKDAEAEQGDDLLIFYFAFIGKLSP